MFDHSFHSRVEAILSKLQNAEVATLATLGDCLVALKSCLREAEVQEQCIRQFLDLAFDRIGRAPAMSGADLAAELRDLLDDTPGLERAKGDDVAWPAREPHQCSRWDVKELDNRLIGSNRASMGRLRNAIGLTVERPLRTGTDLTRRRRFHACKTMQVSDKHDAAINGEQVDRLIRYLGRGDSDSDPRGGRHAILG
jgi:hypothetical protein